MTAPDTVYYTTDGSDPRLAGGAIAPTAFTYAAGISLAQSGQIKARTLARGSWSALNEAAFTVQTQ